MLTPIPENSEVLYLDIVPVLEELDTKNPNELDSTIMMSMITLVIMSTSVFVIPSYPYLAFCIMGLGILILIITYLSSLIKAIHLE
jgi:hypothetical protein